MARLVDYGSLSPEERLRRVGALFYKAAILAIARRDATNDELGEYPPLTSRSSAGNEPETVNVESLDENDLRLLQRYARLGEIAPREATDFWGVSRTTAYRRLLRLEQGGWIAREGATTATHYTFTKQTRALLEQVKQVVQIRSTSRSGHDTTPHGNS